VVLTDSKEGRALFEKGNFDGRLLCRFGAVSASFRPGGRLVGSLCGKRATATEISKPILTRSLGCDADHRLGITGVGRRKTRDVSPAWRGEHKKGRSVK
jgi:hypothetical protein